MSEAKEKIEQFFVNLYAMVAKFGNIYLTSDFVHYRDEQSAKTRCKAAMDIRKIVKYAHITEENCPTTWEELDAMFNMVEQPAAKTVDMSATKVGEKEIAAAATALAKKKAGRPAKK